MTTTFPVNTGLKKRRVPGAAYVHTLANGKRVSAKRVATPTPVNLQNRRAAHDRDFAKAHPGAFTRPGSNHK